MRVGRIAAVAPVVCAAALVLSSCSNTSAQTSQPLSARGTVTAYFQAVRAHRWDTAEPLVAPELQRESNLPDSDRNNTLTDRHRTVLLLHGPAPVPPCTRNPRVLGGCLLDGEEVLLKVRCQLCTMYRAPNTKTASGSPEPIGEHIRVAGRLSGGAPGRTPCPSTHWRLSTGRPSHGTAQSGHPPPCGDRILPVTCHHLDGARCKCRLRGRRWG
jgi:hypothetical protein